jgi:hypothetical protein
MKVILNYSTLPSEDDKTTKNIFTERLSHLEKKYLVLSYLCLVNVPFSSFHCKSLEDEDALTFSRMTHGRK